MDKKSSEYSSSEKIDFGVPSYNIGTNGGLKTIQLRLCRTRWAKCWQLSKRPAPKDKAAVLAVNNTSHSFLSVREYTGRNP